MPEKPPLLQLADVRKEYVVGQNLPPIVVLDAISLEIAEGETVAIVGPSGSGKSTLLNIIGTLDRPSRGKVSLRGQDLGTLNENEIAALRNRQIGFIFQAHHLLPQCSVLENVLVPTLAGGNSADNENAQGRAEELLRRVGLHDRLTHRPGQLSGGERQRVAVVRALINQPALVLADEPTGALDRHSADQLGQLLVELNRERRVTLLAVTHSGDLAKKMGRQIELRDGKLAPLA